jgi:TetR/AcrR family transcriptional regulator
MPGSHKPLRKKEKRDPEATREALLRAGAELFAEAGFGGVRVEALAERAGVNKAMINYHFGGKRGLYAAVIESTFAELAARVAELQQSGQSPAEQIDAFIDIVAELATERRPSFPALVIREGLEPSGMQGRMLEQMLEVVLGMTQVFERGIRDGAFRPVDPAIAYLNLIGGLAFFFATGPLRRRAFETLDLPVAPPSAEGYVQYVKQLVRRGLAFSPGAAADQGA